ncbi:hypothetical protein [Actinoplanes sp. NPDC049599]|uniref:hypothetical protein n=1 Tax=Actinoplanes sp. NPDC049599 TaxID=3363903 RepID=UPI003795A8D8
MLRNVPLRLLALAGSLTLLAACGEPPAPPLTAPPGPSASPGTGASGPVLPLPSGYPTGPLPTGTLPPGALPPGALPTLPYVPPATLPPVATTPPRTTATTTPPTPTVSPAAKCPAAGPTKAQVLAVLAGLPGIPDKKLEVAEGPFCSGSWQFAAVRIADEAKAEQLFVVTTGKPTALKVIEAGTDVCSTEVQTKAPAPIRVRACGA